MKTVKVVGQLFWAKHMESPNVQFNPDNRRYEICIGQLTDALATRLTNELGIKIKQRADDKYEQGKYVVAKSNYVIKAVDKDGNPVPADQIGNGTVAELTLSSYAHRMSAMHGNAPSIVSSASIPAITIKELVAPPDGSEAPVGEEEVVL